MKWTNKLSQASQWGKPITNRKQKEQAASLLAQHLKQGDVVGVGSGSTSYITLQALAQRRDQEGIDFRAIPTSIEMELACAALSVPTTLLRVERPDWSFDGADEVDPKGNMIKGRGGAMLREKMMMQASKKVFIVIDASKHVSRLGQNFPVPIEIYPDAIHIVEASLRQFDSITAVELRQAVAKDGPVITENGNLILDVRFSKIDDEMEETLKAIVGVAETGLFMGYQVNLIESDKI